MAEQESPDTQNTITINVKSTRSKVQVTIPLGASVKKLKEEVEKKLDDPPKGALCLIFAGKILKDEESLESQGVAKDGLTVHLVIRPPKLTQPNSSSSGSGSSSTSAQSNGGSATATSTSASTTPQSSSGTGTAPPFNPFAMMGAMGGGLPGMGDMQAQMQQLMSNPEMMTQIMESPMMQSLMANPETLQSLLTANPQIQQLMERNPELTHILHNPDLMRQAMEMARNPAAMREMMRSQDRQLSNIESIPGGFNALARMYSEIQEPMMDAAQESLQQQLQSNPFSALFTPQQNTPDPGPVAPQGTTNTAPLPNPWPNQASQQSSSQNSSSTTTSSTPDNSTSTNGRRTPGSQSNQPQNQSQPANPMAGMFGPMFQMMQNSSGAGSGNPGMFGGGLAGGLGMMQNPAYQAMYQQVMSNPQSREMVLQMMRNPEMMRQSMQMMPGMAGNPQMQQQMMDMIQSEEFQATISNPEALEAYMQISQGYARLLQAQGSRSSGASNQSNQSNQGPSNVAGVPMAGLLQFMQQQQQGRGMQQPQPSSGSQPPSRGRRYQPQLERLEAMGFIDREANLQALEAAGGDINGAIDRLVNFQ